MTALVLAAVGATAVLLQLFLGKDVGLADNGDGFRLMCHFSLLKHHDVLFNPLEVRYDNSGPCLPSLAYFSSQQWLAAPAVIVYRLWYGGQAGFDLRAFGVVDAVVFGAAVAVLHVALPGSRVRRVVTTVVAITLLVDISFVSYFVSPLSEPATFIGLLLVVAAAAWYVRAGRRVALPALVLLVAAGIFLSLAKSQSAVFALLLAPVLLLRPVGGRAVRPGWRGRVAPGVAALVLLAVSGASLVHQPAFFTRVNVHNLVFFTLLPQSPDPAGTLRDLGASPALVRYSGSGYFSPQMPERMADPAYQAFQTRVSRGDVVYYIVTHPRYWQPMLREAAVAAGVVRVNYMSNYREVRPPDQLEAPRPAPVAALLSRVSRVAWPALPLIWVTVVLAAAVVSVRPSTSPARRATAVVCYLLSAGALSQVVVALLGDGFYEMVKHTVLASFATALLGAVAAGLLADKAVHEVRRRAGRARSDGRAARLV